MRLRAFGFCFKVSDYLVCYSLSNVVGGDGLFGRLNATRQ